MIIQKIKSKFKNVKALDVYVTFSILSLVVYTIISQLLAIYYGVILDTLTTCFFGFFGGEIVTCGLIKIFKLNDIRKENILTTTSNFINANNNFNSNDNSNMGVG